MVQPSHKFVEYDYLVKNINMVLFYFVDYNIDVLFEHVMKLTIMINLIYFQMFHVYLRIGYQLVNNLMFYYYHIDIELFVFPKDIFHVHNNSLDMMDQYKYDLNQMNDHFEFVLELNYNIKNIRFNKNSFLMNRRRIFVGICCPKRLICL
jgi:hypothetical protein